MIKLFCYFLFVLSNIESSVAAGRVKDNVAAKGLNERGTKIDNGSKVVLNQYLKENKAQDDSYYSLTFTCKHSASKKSDSCSVSDINYRK